MLGVKAIALYALVICDWHISDNCFYAKSYWPQGRAQWDYDGICIRSIRTLETHSGLPYQMMSTCTFNLDLIFFLNQGYLLQNLKVVLLITLGQWYTNENANQMKLNNK